MNKQRLGKIGDWTIFLSYTLLIYCTLPIMPRIWIRFINNTGNLANYLAALVLGLIGFLLIGCLIWQRKKIHSFIWLAILALFYALALSNLKLAIERIHFIEYGLLGIFAFRALRHSISNKSLYVYSALTVFCLGLIDERIQYVLPNRVYDTRDVVINGLAGILALLIIALCFQPSLQDLKEKKG